MRSPNGVAAAFPSTIAIGAIALLTALAVPASLHAQDAEDAQVSLTDTIPEADLMAMIETGAGLFNGGSCTACHAVGGRGDGRRGPDLTDVEWLHGDGTFEGIFQTIMWGVKKDEIKAMTPRPFQMNPDGGMGFSWPDRQAVAAYVWSLSNGQQPAAIVAQNEFLDLLESGRADAARERFGQAGTGSPDALLFGERAINNLGYAYLRTSQPETAVAVFELNTEHHPDSWNAWDSLAEAHMAAGNGPRAIELYEKSLELNPENDNAREMIARIRSE